MSEEPCVIIEGFKAFFYAASFVLLGFYGRECDESGDGQMILFLAFSSLVMFTSYFNWHYKLLGKSK